MGLLDSPRYLILNFLRKRDFNCSIGFTFHEATRDRYFPRMVKLSIATTNEQKSGLRVGRIYKLFFVYILLRYLRRTAIFSCSVLSRITDSEHLVANARD